MDKSNNSQIVLATNKQLGKIDNSISLINKLVYNGADQLFNEGFFYLFRSHIKLDEKDFIHLLENNRGFFLEILLNVNFRWFWVTTNSKIKKDYKRALKLFTQAINIKPNFINAYLFRGISKLGLGYYMKPQKAISDFNKVIDLDALNVSAFNFRGLTYGLTKLCKYDKALADFDRAIDIDNKNPFSYFNRALCYDWKEGYFCDYSERIDYQKNALDNIANAIKLNPNCVQFYSTRIGWRIYGSFKLLKDDNEGLIEDCSNAIELEPNYIFHYLHRGRAKEELGDYESAINDYEKAIEINPKDLNGPNALKKIKEKLKQSK